MLATEGFPDPCSPRAHPPARHHHGHASPSPASGQTPWRSQRRQGLRQQGAVSRSGTRQGAGGRKQRAGGRGNLEPAEASVPRPAPAPDPHHPPRAVAQPLAAPVSPEGEGGVGIGWWGWRGSRIKLAGLHNTLKPPSASQAPTPSQIGGARARRRASRSELVAGGVGGGSPSRRLSAERRRQILVKWQKMFLEKIVVFRAFGGRLGLCWWAQAWGPPPLTAPPKPGYRYGLWGGQGGSPTCRR